MEIADTACCDGAGLELLPPPRFELQISRLPGKGGYSTTPPGTTNSLIIWVELEVYVASVTMSTYLSPLGANVLIPD